MILSEDPTRSGAASACEAPPEAQDHQDARSPRRHIRVIRRCRVAAPAGLYAAMTARALAMGPPCPDSAELSRALASRHRKTRSRLPARRSRHGNSGIGRDFLTGVADGALG